MVKEFYYLDEKEQKGPFNIDQLKKVGLKADTLVWTDGFENWKPVKDIEELRVLLRKAPPPIPTIDNSQSYTISSEKVTSREVVVEDSNVKFWTTFKIFTTIFLSVSLIVLTTYLKIDGKRQTLKKEIYDKVDKILDGKSEILDGVQSLTQGALEESNLGKKTKFKSDDLFPELLEKWWEKDKVYTIYKASNGGFTIKQLTRYNDDLFQIFTMYSGDMGYKTPISNNYRLPVTECYRKAFEFFTKEDRKSPGAYSPGKYFDITNFAALRNEYFYIKYGYTPSQYSSSDDSSSWGEHLTNISTDDWVVYYKVYGSNYEITENSDFVYKELFTYLGIALGSFFILLIITLISKPKYFRNLNLFGKRWKNTSYQEQIFFFEHSFFGKHNFIEIINDKVSKGVIKFTDKGNTINLSYTNKELFYKIEKINQDDLILVSIKDKSNITFRRDGAKEIEVIKTEEKTIRTVETNQNI